LNTTATNSFGDASIQYKLDKAGTLTVRTMYKGNSENGGSISAEKTFGVTQENNLRLKAFPYTVGAVAVAIAVCASSAFVIRKIKLKN
jgi:hypothetical protein